MNSGSKELVEDLDWRRVARYCNVGIGKGHVARWLFDGQDKTMDIRKMFNKATPEQLIGIAAAILYVVEEKINEHSTD